MKAVAGKSLWWKRIGWLVLIWAASVAAWAGLAYVIRAAMQAAGLLP